MKERPIIIDEEFRALIPPMSADSLAQLEANIVAHGLMDPLTLWEHENSYILIDGHHRFEILKKLGREPFLADDTETFRIYNRRSLDGPSLANREAVKLWILENQIGRRNLTKEQRIEMVARIVVLRQEQSAATSKANLKKGPKQGAVPDVPKLVPSGIKTVRAAAKEFDVPRKPLQAAVTSLKNNHVPQPPKKNPNYNRAETRGCKNKPHLVTLLRRLMAIAAASGSGSPFPCTVDKAFYECDTPEVAEAVIYNLAMATRQLAEHYSRFEELFRTQSGLSVDEFKAAYPLGVIDKIIRETREKQASEDSVQMSKQMLEEHPFPWPFATTGTTLTKRLGLDKLGLRQRDDLT